MDLNFILLWFVAVVNVGAIVRTIRDPYSNSRGWIYSASFILLITAIAFLTIPHFAGYIGMVASLLWGFMPTIGFRKVNQLITNQEYAKARHLWGVLRYLHPIQDWSARSNAITAQERMAKGDLVGAKEILEQLTVPNTFTENWAKRHLFLLTGDWEGLLTWITNRFSDEEIAADGEVLHSYLRALGETGKLNLFLEAFKRHQSSLERYATLFPICSLFVFALCGRREALVRLLTVIRPPLPKNVSEMWRATADLAAGNEQVAHQQFQAILASETPILLRATIDRRLRLGLTKADEMLTPESQAILAEIVSTWEKLEKYSPHPKEETGLLYITYSLIGLNIVMFLLQMVAGGSQDIQVAYRLGAVLPSAVIDGQWWRLVTALFLHYGFVHLFFNMFALYDLGRDLEPRLGRLNYLVTYFVAGIGSMLFVVLLETALQPARPALVVGASGSVLGLLGANGAIMWQAWRREGVQLARRQLFSLLLILGLQFILDLLVPQISLTAHLSGVAIGFLVTSLFITYVSEPGRVTLEKA